MGEIRSCAGDWCRVRVSGRQRLDRAHRHVGRLQIRADQLAAAGGRIVKRGHRGPRPQPHLLALRPYVALRAWRWRRCCMSWSRWPSGGSRRCTRPIRSPIPSRSRWSRRPRRRHAQQPPTPVPTPCRPQRPPSRRRRRSRTATAPPRIGLSAPIGTTMDPRAALKAPDSSAAKQVKRAGHDGARSQARAAEEASTTEPKEIVKPEPVQEAAKEEPAKEWRKPNRQAEARTGQEPPKQEQQQAALAAAAAPLRAAAADARKGPAAARGAAAAGDLARNPATGPAAATPAAAEAPAAAAAGAARQPPQQLPPAARQQLPSSPLSPSPSAASAGRPQQASRQAPLAVHQSGGRLRPAQGAGGLSLERRPQDLQHRYFR